MNKHDDPQHLWVWKTACKALAILTCLLAMPLSHANTPPPASATIEFSDENLALLDVRFKQYRVGDGVEAYIVNDRVYLPLVDVFALLELNISTTADGAAGWFINENYDFALRQTESGWLATVIGMEVEVPEDEIVQFYDMLYADIQLLEDWFGARLTLNFSQSLLTLSTQQKLPFEKRIERSERVIHKRHLPRIAKNPLLVNPYSLAEMPSLDLSATHLTQRYEKTDKKTETRTTYSVISHGDLGYMNSEILVSGEREEGVLSTNVRLQRYDHNGSLLGPLGATHIALGDISTPGIPLASGGGNGRGIVINNKDLSVNQKSGTRVIDGNYHPGWDVELYQNGIVIGSQIIGADGRYEFSEIPLFLGNNRFNLRFYGPGGKEETEERTLFVGASEDDVGKIKYNASIFQPSLKSINVDDANDEREAYEQAVFSAQYGLSPNSSLHTGFVHKERDSEDPKDFYNIGLQSSLWNTSLLFDATTDDKSNNTFAFSASQYFNRTSLRLGLTEYDKSDPSVSDPKRRLSFGASGQLLGTPYNFSARREEREDSTEDTYNLGVSGNLDRLRWSNTLDFKRLNRSEGRSKDVDGSVFLGYSLNPINFRLSLNYEISPEAEIESTDLSTYFAIDNNTSINFSARYRPENNNTRYNLGMTWRLPYLQLTPSVSYDDDGEILGLITVSASLGTRSSSDASYYNLSNASQANHGTFKARLFEDRNNNGYYELGEPLLEGGEISAQQSHRRGRSNEEGVAWLERVTAWQQTDIAYEQGSINSAPMVYTGKPFSVVSRPGSMIAVNMPFARTGELDGTVYRKDGDTTFPARGIRLSLTDDQGNIIEQGTTDAYGFFLFESLVPNDYRIKAMNEEWLNPISAQFTITNDGDTMLDRSLFLGPTPPLKDTTSLLEETPVTPSLLSKTPVLSSYQAKLIAPVAKRPITEKTAPKPQPRPPIKVQPAKATAHYFWSLQVASYGRAENAQRLQQQLQAQGHIAFSRSVIIGERRFIRVYAGKKTTKDQILAIKTSIDQSIKVNSLPAKLNAKDNS